MRAFWIRSLVIVAVMAALGGSLEAQRRPAARRSRATTPAPRLGAHLGYNFDGDAALVGAQASFALAPSFDLYPSFDFYFVDPGSLWSLNLDVRYRPPTRYSLLYFGGGINYSRASAGGLSGSDTNLNLIGGVEGRRRRATPYGELRLTIGNGSSFQIAGGVSWRL